MINIIVKDESKEAFDNAMRVFKKVCQKDGFLQELKDRKYYKKPSDKKRENLKKLRRN